MSEPQISDEIVEKAADTILGRLGGKPMGNRDQSSSMKISKSYGSIWRTGELIAGFDKRRTPSNKGTYSILLCVSAREFGPRGALREPAHMAEISGGSWASVCRAVQRLGFTCPRLTATEVRRAA